MVKFIDLTDAHGRQVAVNPALIAMIQPTGKADYQSSIVLADGKPYGMKEAPDEIKQKILDAYV